MVSKQLRAILNATAGDTVAYKGCTYLVEHNDSFLCASRDTGHVCGFWHGKAQNTPYGYSVLTDKITCPLKLREVCQNKQLIYVPVGDILGCD